jgi:putative transposase
MRNLLATVPRHAQPMVASLVRTIFARNGPRTPGRSWSGWSPSSSRASSATPPGCWPTPPATCWPTPPSPRTPGGRCGATTRYRLNREIRRRTDVVGIFPNRAAVVRLVGAVLAEQHDEWTVARRYLGLDVIRASLVTVVDGTPKEELKQLLSASA